jgi:hypothetical protein
VEAEVIQAALKVLHAEEAPTAGPGTDRGGGLSLQRPPANLSGAGLAYREEAGAVLIYRDEVLRFC